MVAKPAAKQRSHLRDRHREASFGKAHSRGIISTVMYRLENLIEVTGLVQGVTVLINPDGRSQDRLIAAPTNYQVV
jgi:hypothetical protein